MTLGNFTCDLSGLSPTNTFKCSELNKPVIHMSDIESHDRQMIAGGSSQSNEFKLMVMVSWNWNYLLADG